MFCLAVPFRQGNWANPHNPYSSDGMPHGSRGLVVIPLPPALCSLLQEFPAHEQKCLKPCTDWQSKMIHYSSRPLSEFCRSDQCHDRPSRCVVDELGRTGPQRLEHLCSEVHHELSSVREQNGSWVAEAWTMPAEAVCSLWEAVVIEIEVYKALLHNYLSVY